MKKPFYVLSAAMAMGVSAAFGVQSVANAADKSPAGHEVVSGNESIKA